MMEEAKEDENNQASASGEGSSWWGGWPNWLQAAKEKSSTALEFMKRDLSELSQVVQTDAVAAVSSTAAVLKEKFTVDNVETVAIKARDSVSSFLEVLSDVFVPMREIEDGENIEAYVIKNSEPVILGWWQAQLYNIRRDPKTYCHEPEGPPEIYENWMESFDLDDYEDEMANMMLECHEVCCLYDQLVPSSVSHSEFWHRYFYRIYLLKKAEAKRAELMTGSAEELCREAEKAESFKEKTNPKSGDNTAAFAEIPQTKTVATPLSQDARTLVDKDSVKISESSEMDSSISSTPLSSKTDHSSVTCITDPECNSIKTAKTTTFALKEAALKDKLESEVADACSEVSETCTIGKDSPMEIITDDSRSTPSDTASKEYSTGDEWEKDFDLEDNTKQMGKTLPESKSKQVKGDEDWEKW